MSLSRPQSRASSGGRGPPPTPPPTYLWEEVRRQRSRGGYPWTILDKQPLENTVDVELLLKGEISGSALNGSLPEEYSTESLQRKRLSRRDRYNQGRARSEPTPSIPSSGSAIDMASAAVPKDEEIEAEVDDFPLTDEDIPDFVMEYLQSDAGNLEDNIPDHILEYIQSRAAALQRKQEPEDDIVYTEEELRIIEDTRRKMEERGELPKLTVSEAEPEDPEPKNEDEDFDVFFQRALDNAGTSAKAADEPSEPPAAVIQAEETGAKPKKGGRFKLRSISMPPKPQLNLRLPKALKRSKETPNEETKEKTDKKKEKKEKRMQSVSPIRQKINEQFQSWNNSLKKLKPMGKKNKNKEDDVKGFVALLPGVSSGKSKDQEHQYEEVQAPHKKEEYFPDEELDLRERLPDPVTAPQVSDPPAPVVTVTGPDDLVLEDLEVRESEESMEKLVEVTNPEETMEDVENLPESEIAEPNQFVPDDEEILEQDLENEEEPGKLELDGEDLIEEPGKLEPDEEDIIEEPGKLELDEEHFVEEPEDVEQVPAAEVPEQKSKASILAARGLKALEATKSTIQRKLSRENLEATRNKLHATLTGTLKKRGKNKGKNKSSTLPRQSGQQNIFETSTAPRGKSKDYETSTPIDIAAPKRNRQKKKEEEIVEFPATVEYPTATRRKNKKIRHSNALSSIAFDDNFQVETSEVELEQVDKQAASADEGSDKENHVVVPNPRRRSKNRLSEKRYGFHEDFMRPQSAYYTSEARKSWNEFNRLSQDIQDAFSAPVNSLEAVDGIHGESVTRRPQRPSRSTARKNRFSTRSEMDNDYHDYCNVPNPNPRRLKKTKKSDSSFTTWPRKHDLPCVPKRSRKPKTVEVENFGTWPRKCEVALVPTAPRRTRSRTRTNILSQDNDFNDVETRYDVPNSQPIYNITPTEVPETVYSFETKEEEELKMDTEDIAFADEDNVEDVREEEIEEKPEINQLVEAEVPKAPLRKIRGRTGSFRLEKKSGTQFETWPRVKKEETTVPVAPGRSHRKSQFLEQQPPSGATAPSVTPTESEPKISNDEALQELDQLLETLATTQQQSGPSNPVPAAESKAEDPYSEIKLPCKSPPPRPPPPIYSPQSTTSYSYIYTVPRRSPRTYHESHRRNVKDYCTIRPHRPPRRSRPRTEVYEYPVDQSKEAGRRHSITNAEDVNVEGNKETAEQIDGDVNTEEQRERKLQDSSVIEKMRGRPLPAPPRSKRIRSHSPPLKPPRREPSLRRKGSLRASEPRQEKPAVPKPVHIDGYEPVSPEPIKVEEVSIAIQTDPLPEYDDLLGSTLTEAPQEPENFEINNNYNENNEVQEHLNVENVEVDLPESPELNENVEEVLESPCDVPETLEDPVEEKVQKKPENSEEKSSKTKESTEESSTNPRFSRNLDDEDSYSRIPPNFPLAFPRLNVEFPSRLQLAELDVDRLNVRDLQAQRLVVSNIDTQSLQVSEITSSSGPLLLSTAQDRISVPVSSVPETPGFQEQQGPKAEDRKPVETSDVSLQCEIPHNATMTTQTDPEPEIPRTEPEKRVEPEPEVHEEVPVLVPRLDTEPPEPTVGELTLQLVGVSARQLGRATGVLAQYSWQVAQRVARLGWERIDEQLRARGVHLSKRDEQNVQVIVILIMIVIAGILLLGMGRRGLGHRWEIYYPY